MLFVFTQSSYLQAAADWITTCLVSSGFLAETERTPFTVSIVLIISSTLSLGAALIENVDKFAKVSILSNIIAIVTIVAIIICSVIEPEFLDGVKQAEMFGNFDEKYKILLTIGTLATTYVYTQITLQLFYSLKRPSLNTWHKAEFCGMTMVIILTVTTGLLGYFAFKTNSGKIDDNILQNFDKKNMSIAICRILYAISILLTFPMQMLSGRKSAAFLYNFNLNRKLDQELSTMEFRLITFVIWIISVFVGIYAAYNGLDAVLSVGGCFVGTYMGFVLPAACYLWSNKNVTTQTLKPLEKVIANVTQNVSAESGEQKEQDNKDIEQQNNEKIVIPDDIVPCDTWYDKFGAWCLFIIGFVLMFVATGISAYHQVYKETTQTK